LKPHISEPNTHLTIKVGKGENLEMISQRFRTSTYAILKDNPGISMFPKAGTRLNMSVKLMKRINAKGNPLIKSFASTANDIALN